MDSQIETDFLNIGFLRGDSDLLEFSRRPGAAFFVDSHWRAQAWDSHLFGYYQSSCGLTPLKRLSLQEPVFAQMNLGIDPYSLGLWQSQLFKVESQPESVERAVELGATYFRLSGQAYKMAGAEDFHELAIIMASILQLERDYEGQLSLEQLGKTLSIEVTVSSHVFESVSKIRSLKTMINRLGELSSEFSSPHFPIYGVPSFRHMGSREPWTNLLRLTAMQSATVMGGARGFVNLPFDFLTEAQGGRISRNSMEILNHESHLNKILNSDWGSSYGNELCDHLCEKAWTLFVEIENKGGLKDCLRSGWLHDEIRTSHEKEMEEFGSRRKILTGVNQFPLVSSLDEKFPLASRDSVLSLETFWSGYVDTEGFEKLCDVERLVPVLLASEFEEWQFRGQDIMKKRNGNKIPVLVESPECRQKKFGPLRKLMGLVGLEIAEISPEKMDDSLVLMMASAPDNPFTEGTLAKIKKETHSQVFWVGDTKVPGFDGHINDGGSLQATFTNLFEILEKK